MKEKLELDAHRQLPGVKNEIGMAGMKLALIEEEENGPGFDAFISEALGEEYSSGYLIDCRIQSEPTFEAPVHSTAEGAMNYQADLPRVELEYFTGYTPTCWSFFQQFEDYIENRVKDD